MPSSNLNARLNYDQGRTALEKNQYNEASEFFRQAVEADPRFVEAHKSLADAYERLGYAHRAKKALESLLRITTDPAEKSALEARLAQLSQGAGR
jgi:uncharacterized protein HemY